MPAVRHAITWASTVVLILSATAAIAWGQEIDGVQPAALDQPRVSVVVAAAPAAVGGKTPARTARPAPAIGQTIEAYLDTGASGLLLSDAAAKSAGLGRERIDGAEARFHDIGVGGGDEFAVSDPLTVTFAGTALTAGPARAQVGPLGQRGPDAMALLAQALGATGTTDLNVIGMPAMAGRVVVMDVRGVHKLTEKIHTTVLDGVRSAPRTPRHVRLSFASFDKYTTTTPDKAEPPALAGNPFIGPCPAGAAAVAPQLGAPQSRAGKPAPPATPKRATPVPPITIQLGGRRSTGSWLLDTGSATSMISKSQAGRLGITYAAGTEKSDTPRLAGVPAEQQFTLTVGGIGGQRKAAGFYLDRLVLPTTEGRPITYVHAPVLVADITATAGALDAGGTSVTLDGVFGMNYLVASMKVPDSLLAMPDPSEIKPGPYLTVVFDQPRGLLGLE